MYVIFKNHIINNGASSNRWNVFFFVIDTMLVVHGKAGPYHCVVFSSVQFSKF